jgi:hypothetical protein
MTPEPNQSEREAQERHERALHQEPAFMPLCIYCGETGCNCVAVEPNGSRRYYHKLCREGTSDYGDHATPFCPECSATGQHYRTCSQFEGP